MQPIGTDSVTVEVRAIRDKYAAQFDRDVAAIFWDLRFRQKSSRRDYVWYPARDVETRSDFVASGRHGRATDATPSTS